ncbi:energy-coupling factor ABC transporter ATP-binding protein [Cetobacterium somerae]
MIKLESIKFSYNQEIIFQDFSINFKKGKFYTLLGKNGSGKSTLIKLILGIEKVSQGNIYIDNLNIRESLFQCRKNIGIVFQNPDEQLVTDIVEEEIAFSMENYGYSSDFMKRKVEKLLKEIDFFEKKNEKISKLSGGEKQRVCIASSLVLDPKILILDEGTAMLDPENRKIILDILRNLSNKGMTVILVTHHLNEIEFCDEVIYLEKNKINFNGPKKLFMSFLVKNEIDQGIELPLMFKVARSIYLRTKKDVSEDIFNLNKMGEHLWKSL